MTDLASIDQFLLGKRLALVGVSTHPQDFSRTVYAELVKRGYDVVPIRPGLDAIKGVRAYARLQDVPGELDGAILMTPPEVTARVVVDCAEAHVPRVWMHRGVGHGAVEPGAVRFCQTRGIEVIAGECPLMFLSGTTGPHKLHAAVRRAFGTYPRDWRRSRPRVAPLLVHGVVGWALCAVTMGLLMATLSTGLAIWLHALAAPLWFALVAAHYFKRPDAYAPLAAASTFVAIVALLDLTIVAGLVLRSLEMFEGFAGVWLPLLLIFAVTLAVGSSRGVEPSHSRA